MKTIDILLNDNLLGDILANDHDPDGSLLPGTVVVLSQPASGGTSVNPLTGAVTYQPGVAGSYSFTYIFRQAPSFLRNKTLLDEFMTIESLGLKLRKTYLPKFRQVLPEKRVARYYQIENTIQAALYYELAKEIPLVQ